MPLRMAWRLPPESVAPISTRLNSSTAPAGDAAARWETARFQSIVVPLIRFDASSVAKFSRASSELELAHVLARSGKPEGACN